MGVLNAMGVLIAVGVPTTTGVPTTMGVLATISEFLEDIIGLAQMYDGNLGEVFGDVSETLGICRWCFKQSDDLKDGSCPSCP